MDQRSGYGWFNKGIEVLAIRLERIFPILRCQTREFPNQEEGQSRGTESPERGPVSMRITDRFHDLRLLSSDWRSWHRVGLRFHETVLDNADLFSVTLHDNNIQEVDTRWDEVLLSMSKIASDDVLESLYTLRIRESVQLKTVFEFSKMEIHQKVSMPNDQKLKTMVQRLRSETPITNLWRQAQENWNRSTGQESKDIRWRWSRKRYLLPVERKKANVRRETTCSFRHDCNDHAQKPTPKAATLSDPSMTRGRSVSRNRSIRGKSNHGAILRERCRYYSEYWHPPECQFYKTETGRKAGAKGWRTTKQKAHKKAIIPTKGKKVTAKMLWLLWNCTTIGLCLARLCGSQDFWMS